VWQNSQEIASSFPRSLVTAADFRAFIAEKWSFTLR
jgi:hypothetical protein